MFLFINLTHISSLGSVVVAVCPRSSGLRLVRSSLITDNFVVVLYQKYAAGKKYAAKRELDFNNQIMCYNSKLLYRVDIHPFLGH